MKRFWPVLLLPALACKPSPETPSPSPSPGLYELRRWLNTMDSIADGRVEGMAADGEAFAIRIGNVHRGRRPAETFLLRVRADLDDRGEAAELRRQLAPGVNVVVISGGSTMFLYVRRFFAQASGGWPETGEAAWAYEKVERHLNRCFNGSVEELSALLIPLLEGRAKGPAPDWRRPAIDVDSLRKLPPPGEIEDPEYLPAPFLRGTPPPRDLLPPATPANPAPGLLWEVFDAVTSTVLDELQPLASGKIALPDPSGFKLPEARPAVRFRGYLDVPRDGEYFLTVIAPSRTFLTLAGRLEILQEGGAPPPRRGSDVALRAGRHVLTLETWPPPGGPPPPLRLLWAGPGFAEEPVPAKALSSER